MAINDEIIRLILDIQKGPQNADTVKLVDQLKEKLEQTAVATEKVSKQSGNMGYALLTSGRAIQDFAQGGIGGILNNIEGLTVALGLGAGLAGVLTAVGVAAFVAGPSIKGFFKGLMDGWNEIPEGVNAVEALTDHLKKNSEALDEMKKKQSLTNAELKEFNRMTGEQIGLTRALATAKREEAEEEAMDPAEPARDITNAIFLFFLELRYNCIPPGEIMNSLLMALCPL